MILIGPMKKPIAITLSAFFGLSPGVALADARDMPQIPESADSAFQGDYLSVGVGLMRTSDYEGSDDYKWGPAAGFRGRVGDVRIFSRAIGIGADFLPEPRGSDVHFTLGPVIRYRANRTGKVKDPVVRLLPELDGVMEAGVTMGVSFDGILIKQDNISFGSDVRWGVTGNKGSRIITLNAGYSTPLSPALGVGVSVGVDHVNRDYADYNYSVDTAGSLASGLPVYRGKGGWKNAGGRVFAGYDLDGNIRNGGWVVGAALSYERLLGSAANTPITRLRGSRDQWMMGLGLGYTF